MARIPSELGEGWKDSTRALCFKLAYFGHNESQRAGRRLYFLSKAAFLKKLLTPRRCGRRLATLPERKVRQSERRSPVSFQEAQRAQKPVQEARDISCRITHVARSPDTISMHEHNGTGPELAPAPRRQLRPYAGDRSRLRSARPELVRCRVCRRRFAKEPFACSELLRVYLKDRVCALRPADAQSTTPGENTLRETHCAVASTDSRTHRTTGTGTSASLDSSPPTDVTRSLTRRMRRWLTAPQLSPHAVHQFHL